MYIFGYYANGILNNTPGIPIRGVTSRNNAALEAPKQEQGRKNINEPSKAN